MKIISLFVLMLIVIIVESFFMANVHKTAVRESELTGKSYILCEREITTGYDWLLIQDENGEKINEYFNIIGPDPFAEFTFKYKFYVADNTYIFYIAGKRMYYSEEMRMNMLEYTVTGWDILYPVKHFGYFNIPIINKYIMEFDLWKEEKL